MSYPVRRTATAAPGNPLEKIQFIDIETATAENPADLYHEQTPNVPAEYMKRFERKMFSDGAPAVQPLDHYADNASLYAEHGKIINVTIGKWFQGKICVKSFTGHNEKQILEDVAGIIKTAGMLCAHNGIEFDYPYLFRRYIINDLPVPPILNTIGKKTWDVKDLLLDTMVMWAGTAWNYRASLDLLTKIFGIESPKGDLDGSKINDLYWSNAELFGTVIDADKLKEIGRYGFGDIVALIKVYCRIRGLKDIPEIIYVNDQPLMKPEEKTNFEKAIDEAAQANG